MPDEHLPSITSTTTATQAPRMIATLSDAECRAVLARQRLCVVSVVEDAEPYAVPVYYGFDGTDLYLGVAEGRKTRALDANGRVYILVTEVGPGDAWRSVGVAGRARTLDATERQHGVDVLTAHNRRFREMNGMQPAPPRRSTGGRVLRIEQAVLTGRTFGG